MPAAAARAPSKRIPSSAACSWSAAADEAETRGRQHARPYSWSRFRPGPGGKTVHRVLVEEGCDIARELYLGVGRSIAARRAGADGLERRRHEHRGRRRQHARADSHASRFDADAGCAAYQVRKLAARLGLPQAAASQRPRSSCRRSAGCFVDRDCSLAGDQSAGGHRRDNRLLALDAKMTFDDNALFRHHGSGRAARPGRRGAGRSSRRRSGPELREAGRQHRLPGQRGRAGDEHDGPDQAARRRAGQFSRRRRRGQRRAGDRGLPHSACATRTCKAVLVNIFGGIMRCTTIANAVLEAYKTVGFNVPLVVRLEGTEVEEGRKNSGRQQAEHHFGRRADRRREEGRRRGG